MEEGRVHSWFLHAWEVIRRATQDTASFYDWEPKAKARSLAAYFSTAGAGLLGSWIAYKRYADDDTQKALMLIGIGIIAFIAVIASTALLVFLINLVMAPCRIYDQQASKIDTLIKVQSEKVKWLEEFLARGVSLMNAIPSDDATFAAWVNTFKMWQSEGSQELAKHFGPLAASDFMAVGKKRPIPWDLEYNVDHGMHYRQLRRSCAKLRKWLEKALSQEGN